MVRQPAYRIPTRFHRASSWISGLQIFLWLELQRCEENMHFQWTGNIQYAGLYEDPHNLGRQQPGLDCQIRTEALPTTDSPIQIAARQLPTTVSQNKARILGLSS